jgi:hypothetical protein
MTAPSSIDPARFLSEQLAQASPDLLRQMLTTFIGTLMSAEADAVCGAEYGARTPERANTRNGYRHRDFDTLNSGTLSGRQAARRQAWDGAASGSALAPMDTDGMHRLRPGHPDAHSCCCQ